MVILMCPSPEDKTISRVSTTVVSHTFSELRDCGGSGDCAEQPLFIKCFKETFAGSLTEQGRCSVLRRTLCNKIPSTASFPFSHM